MTHPDDTAKLKTPSEKPEPNPESGSKHLDPTRYQVATFSPELRSEFQKLPLHRYSEDELKPPPGYGGTPATEATPPPPSAPGRTQNVVTFLRRRWLLIAIGCFVGLCGAVTMMVRGHTTPQPAVTAIQPAPLAAAEPKAHPDPTTSDSKSQATPPEVTSVNATRPTEPLEQMASPSVTSTPKRAVASPASTKTKPPPPKEASKPPQERVINPPILER